MIYTVVVYSISLYYDLRLTYRSLNDIKDREICCYSISCKERENIGESVFLLASALLCIYDCNSSYCIIIIIYTPVISFSKPSSLR